MAVDRGDEARGHVVAEEPIELSRYGASLLRSMANTSTTAKRPRSAAAPKASTRRWGRLAHGSRDRLKPAVADRPPCNAPEASPSH